MGAYESAGQQSGTGNDPGTYFFRLLRAARTHHSHCQSRLRRSCHSRCPLSALSRMATRSVSRTPTQVGTPASPPPLCPLASTPSPRPTPGRAPSPPQSAVVLYVFVDRYPVTLTLASSINPSGLNQPVTFTTHISSIGRRRPLARSAARQRRAPHLPHDRRQRQRHLHHHRPQPGEPQHHRQLRRRHHPRPRYRQPLAAGHRPTGRDNHQPRHPSQPRSARPTAHPHRQRSGCLLHQRQSRPEPSASREGNQLLGTQTLTGGAASLTLNSLGLGPHSITATYTPSGPFLASAGVLANLTVLLPTASTLTSSANPSPATQTLNLTARVTSPVNSVPYTLDGVGYLHRKRCRARNPTRNQRCVHSLDREPGDRSAHRRCHLQSHLPGTPTSSRPPPASSRPSPAKPRRSPSPPPPTQPLRSHP